MKTILALILLISYSTFTAKMYSSYFKQTPPGILIQPINKDPEILLLKNFITDDEGKEIKKLAEPMLHRSKVGISTLSEARTSNTAFLSLEENETIKKIAQRAADMVGEPIDYIEFQVVRYQQDQKYDPHHDYFSEENMKSRKSQRLMTFFVYLNDVDEDAGGETEFPNLNLKIKPLKNAAIFWRNLDENRMKDERTLHGGKPVKSGEKWGINIWIHDQKPE